GFGVADTTKPGRTLPARGRLERTIFPGAVFPELVILGPILGVMQYFVGLAYIFELVRGLLCLADVRMILSGQLAIGLLDLLGGGRLTHTQNGVIVFKVHGTPHSGSKGIL